MGKFRTVFGLCQTITLEMCPVLPLLLNDYSQRTVQSGVELCSLVGSVMVNSEPLLRCLDDVDRPEGAIYIKNKIIDRIRKNEIPTLDHNCKSLKDF